MNHGWVVLLTFAGTALLVSACASLAYDTFFRYRESLNERLDELSGKSHRDNHVSLVDLKQLEAQTAKTRNNWLVRWQDATEQAGLSLRLPALVAASLGLGMLLAVAAAILAQRWWVAPVGLLPGLIAPALYIRIRRQVRMRRLAGQLPEAFDVMGRAVRAGQTVPAALQIVADDFDPPIADEFRRCYEQQHLGIPYDVALRDLARRTGIMEIQILVVALLVQSRSGGNIVNLLNTLATMARKRLKMQQRVKALTGEGRMQALVLLVLPVVAFASLLVLSPDYAATLIDRPWLLVATAMAQLAGALWIRQIVSFET